MPEAQAPNARDHVASSLSFPWDWTQLLIPINVYALLCVPSATLGGWIQTALLAWGISAHTLAVPC